MSAHQPIEARYAKRPRFGYKIYWYAAGIAYFFMWIFWVKGQYGDDLSAWLSVILFCYAFSNVVLGFLAYDFYVDEQALREFVFNPTHTDGKARFATLQDAEQHGMARKKKKKAEFKTSLILPLVNMLRRKKEEKVEAAETEKPRGLFLGSLNGEDIYYPGETHLLTIAPPGAGKGTSIVIPNLLLYEGSVIVTDPKGELFAITARHRREKLGHKIIVLCPWADKLSRELGIPISDHGFNPLSIIQEGEDIKDEAELISSLLIPGGVNMKPDDEFWLEGGRSILTAFMLHLKSLEDKVGTLTLPLLRQYLHLPPPECRQGNTNQKEVFPCSDQKNSQKTTLRRLCFQAQLIFQEGCGNLRLGLLSYFAIAVHCAHLLRCNGPL